MHCNQCGFKSPEGSRFCEGCGQALQKAAPQPAPAPIPAPAQHTPPPPPPAYSPPPPPSYQSAPQGYSPYGGGGQSAAADRRDEVMGFGSWLGMFFLLMIPLVNFILMLIWAFGGDVNRNKQNFCRASIVFSLIIGGIAMIIGIIGGVAGALMAGL